MGNNGSTENREEASSKQDSPEDQVLEIEFQNAKQRLTEQRETLKEFSKEGARIFRLMLLFVGAPLAILGALGPQVLLNLSDTLTSNQCLITFPSGCLSASLITILTGLGLIFSAIFNVLAGGFEARGAHNLTNPEDIHLTIQSNRDISDHLRERLIDYRDRIEHNDRIIHIQESLLMSGKFLLILSIYGVGTLIYALLSNVEIRFINWAIVFLIHFLLLGLLLLYVPKEYVGSDTWIRFSPLYSLDYKIEEDKESGTSEEPNQKSSEAESGDNVGSVE